jgi:hypothetical protein
MSRSVLQAKGGRGLSRAMNDAISQYNGFFLAQLRAPLAQPATISISLYANVRVAVIHNKTLLPIQVPRTHSQGGRQLKISVSFLGPDLSI